MTESLDVFALSSYGATASPSSPPKGEFPTIMCDRCKAQSMPWELRSFGGKALCGACFSATLELARAAIPAMPSNEPNRRCSNCRALRDPSLGSAWCAITELGDERARICANFVAAGVDQARTTVTGGRAAALDLWKSVSEELLSALGEENFDTWFGKVDPVELRDGIFLLAVPDEYTRDWLEGRLSPVLQNALALAGTEHVSLTYTIEATDTDDVPGSDDRRADKQVDESEKEDALSVFNPHYTFAEFIVGSGNRLAHASALACVDKPGSTYNPLVLYGGVGVGKTHLLQAIGQEAIAQQKGRVLLTTSEAFTNELVAAIRDGSTGAFRERYRSVDFLLLDDVQFIAGKEATQEEFFHTFNSLHQSGKQIVLTSDRPPSELRVLQDRLRSRFAWGLTVDLQPPDLETRIAIVRAKADSKHRRLHETVVNALATRASANVRELEGALNRVLALADLLGTEPGMEIARTVLGDAETGPGTCRPDDVLQAVSAYYRVKTSDLAGPQRERSLAFARHMAMFLLREEAKLSLVQVGEHLGGRNHTTVIHGCDKIAREIRRKTRVKQDMQAIKQLMYGMA